MHETITDTYQLLSLTRRAPKLYKRLRLGAIQSVAIGFIFHGSNTSSLICAMLSSLTQTQHKASLVTVRVPQPPRFQSHSTTVCLLRTDRFSRFWSLHRGLLYKPVRIHDPHGRVARSSTEASSFNGGASQKRLSGPTKKTSSGENAATEIAPTGGEKATSSRNKDTGHIPGIIYPPAATVGKSTNIVWQGCMVKKEERERLLGQKGCVIWITGLSGSGKSTLACALDHALLSRGKLSYVLDGDNLRHGLNNNLGFSAEDRTENIRRVGEVAKLFVDAGIICIASLISPYQRDREMCRRLVKEGEFIEVYMNIPLRLCEERDPKGLYKLARAGKIKGFTGVDDPYEAPMNCEVVMEPIDGKCPSPAEMVDQLINYLEERSFFTHN